MVEVVIVSAVRTPTGGFLGRLAGFGAVDLGAAVLRAAVSRAGLEPCAVQEVIMGCALTAGLKQAPARRAALDAGLPASVGATAINKLCGSGMKAVMLAHDLLRAGSGQVLLAGGMESMSNAPYLLERARLGLRLGDAELRDHLFLDGLEDAGNGRLMGEFAQEAADRYGIARPAMDSYAIGSLQRARAAIADGALAAEIVPLELKGRRGKVRVTDDELPSTADPARIAASAPAFRPDGSITAASCAPMGDGASALLLMTADEARRRGIEPLARIIGHATQSQEPADFTLAPVGAIEKLLRKVGWNQNQVDLYEINEAFAMVAILAIRCHGLEPARVNLFGGACAQGHPISSSGARIIVTLLNALRRSGGSRGSRGIASLCIGGGEATALALELL